MDQSIHSWDHSFKNILIVGIDKKLNAQRIFIEGELCQHLELDRYLFVLISREYDFDISNCFPRQFLISAIDKLGQESGKVKFVYIFRLNLF